ncbi:MAG: Unknown protein [uncultured Sulfurovum sp.]|uniref:ATPase AAA-type core domain-containing protein n=1 Tax=uncultured Sulfurovum sp. TaxID=269237 RepID=A0A6S6SR70_9BACT|nr:MAG: Unknown protein [uncultured Sulfurovum sp.]
MIEKVKIEGFKSIKSQEFEFKGLTILTGLNSTGKSSVVQSILLLSSFNSIDNPVLRKHVKKFSTFSDVRNKYENVNEINLGLQGQGISTSMSIERSNSWKVGLMNESNKITFEENLFYISSNRIGPEDIANYDEDMKFGIDGEYLFGYFEQNKRTRLDNLLIKDESHNTLDAQVSYWLNYILDISLRVETQQQTADTIKVTFVSDGIEGLSPFNVGAGNSYLAKILIMGLSCSMGHILIIENPEIHLHPKAQSKLADFFVLLEKAGIQVIVETHSEHLINKLRYNVYKKKLASDNIVIYYKSSIQKNFGKISINKNGHFIDDKMNEIDFPSGFFDSTLSELLEIM